VRGSGHAAGAFAEDDAARPPQTDATACDGNGADPRGNPGVVGMFSRSATPRAADEGHQRGRAGRRPRSTRQRRQTQPSNAGPGWSVPRGRAASPAAKRQNRAFGCGAWSLPRPSSAGEPCTGSDRPAHHSPQPPDSPAGFLESCRGSQSPALRACDRKRCQRKTDPAPPRPLQSFCAPLLALQHTFDGPRLFQGRFINPTKWFRAQRRSKPCGGRDYPACQPRIPNSYR
jgi:hypothetical protein